ncbi:MAG: glutamate racemase [Lachnospiraceae bacterium]|nr:glutamate racemase [Robinsoniella sp.]MDY3767432.1 glutamate racemase [Lachnospiraceae bacterium]
MAMEDISTKRNLPIGFMDSGLGGLSVLREAVRIMPYEDFIYYGDSLNAPYGTKDQEVIRKLTFHVAEQLLEQGIKALTVACNTATSAAIRQLRVTYPDLPIIGIEPAIKPAVIRSHGGRILVLATPMTIQQEKFHRLLDLYKDQAEIIPVKCEGLMEFVEQGNLDGKALDLYFEEHLAPYLSENTETIVLGCTHYPFLKHHLRTFLGNKKIEIIDGSLGTSLELKRQLEQHKLLRPDDRKGQIIIQNSSPRQELIHLSWRLLSFPID